MIKIIWIAILVTSLTACKETASLQTQGSAQAQVVANEYQLFINFKQGAKDQKELMEALQKKTSEFIGWFNGNYNAEKIVGENIRLQPQYEYPKNQVRKLIAYEANQRFRLIGLTYQQYNQLMKDLPDFKAESFGLQTVKASDEALLQSRVKLVEEAFLQSQTRAQQLADLSQLCELTVLDIKEFDQGGSQPRMMSMRMKEDSSAPSQHSHSVRVEVTWSANPC